MSNSAFYFNIIIITVVVLGAVIHSVGSVEAVPHCHQNERQALLSFKHDLTDPTGRLSSWVPGGNCCNWHGVVCDNLTGHVLELQLGVHWSSDGGEDSLLGGRIDNSLLDLKHLRYLDLSSNDFGGIQIPSFIGSIQSLTYLNLSNAWLGGEIPPHLGNLSNLLYLDIGYSADLHTKNLRWLSGLSMLRYLDFSNVRCPHPYDAFHGIDALPHLEELHLQGFLHSNNGHNVQFPFANSSNIVILDLSVSTFYSLPGGLENLTSLKYLDLSICWINSPLPSWLYKFSQLEKLMLGTSFIHGTISDDIGNLTLLNHLDMSYNVLEGKIPTSLGQLSYLEYFDLTNNNIYGQIPDSIGSLNSLKKLMLSFNQLNGTLPPTLGQLHRLEYIDLSSNSIPGPIHDSFQLLNSLISLDFSKNSISGPIPRSFRSLTSLEWLDLSSNQLSGTLPGQTFVHLHHLKRLDFSNNSISSPIPDSFGSKFLEHLDLSGNELNGTLSQSIWELNGLSFLNLGYNSIYGAIPDSMGSLASLSYLNLSSNKLSGSLSPSLGQLIRLETLDVSFNSLEGLLSSSFFANLKGLLYLTGTGNRIRMEVDPDWIPPFQLNSAYLSSWYFGKSFPKWLSSQESLQELDISCTGINDFVPGWFWNMTNQLDYLNMSHNHLRGEILRSSYTILDLSNNLFSGSISRLLCDADEDYRLSSWVQILHLGDNKLSGEIPDCWSSWSYLRIIKLQNNNLTGSIPKSLGSLGGLQYLHLRNNSLSGVLPSSLQNCTYLEVVDIAENKLGGRVPKWIGQRLSNLRILNLRSNNFGGYIPHEFCALSLLVVLDLAHNNLSGRIPNCLANLSAMAKPSMFYFTYTSREYHIKEISSYEESEVLVIKALVLEYTKNLRFMTLIDLSNNSLSGPIPEGITNLVALMSLNLSGNSLTEKIPNNIGNMSVLEALDLSLNKLSGDIPQSMTDMTFLGLLNLSFNNLTGRIPTSTQLQSFNASSYIGNKLCGPPVSTNCGSEGSDPKEKLGDNKHHGLEYDDFFVSMSVGFVVGLGAVIAPLLYSTWWRLYFFQWLQNMWDRLWVWTVLLFRT